MKRPWQMSPKPIDFAHLPFTPLPAKKVRCPICGKVGELTSQRNAEGELILKCNDCKIFYSQHLKKGFCLFGVNDKNGKRLQRKSDGEEVFVRPVLPSECMNCIVHTNKKVNCPFYAGAIGGELLPPEGWEKT